MTATEYINQDVKDWNYKPKPKDWIMRGETFLIYRYVRHLRGYEYYSFHRGQKTGCLCFTISSATLGWEARCVYALCRLP